MREPKTKDSDAAVRESALDNITKARVIFQRHDPTTGSSGWVSHIDTVCSAIEKLKSHYGDRADCTSIFDRWRNERRTVMSPQEHDSWHSLIQYGVQELLYFLHGCLVDLIGKKKSEEALKVLVRESNVFARLQTHG